MDVWQLGFSHRGPKAAVFGNETQGGGGGANVSMDRDPYRGSKSSLSTTMPVLDAVATLPLLCRSRGLLFAIVGGQTSFRAHGLALV